MRWLIFLTTSKSANRITARYTRGLSAAFLKLGRRRLINEERFFRWVEQHQDGGRRPGNHDAGNEF